MSTTVATQATSAESTLVSLEDELAVIRRYVSQPYIRIIEAGCGRRWPRQLANPSAVLIGVDVDTAALALRKDLTETHIGDVLTIDLPHGQADVVYSSYVLEHVRGADRALRNFVDWLKPGGVMILRVPDRNSVYGFITRITPHWFHVFYRKYIDRFKDAGKPGYGPYPTYHDAVISRRGIREFSAAHGCEVLHDLKVCYYLKTGDSRMLKKVVAIAVSVLSLGTLAWRHDNLCLIIRKNAAETGSRSRTA